MRKQIINDSRTIILGRGKESTSALQQLVVRSMELKNQIVKSAPVAKIIVEKQSKHQPNKNK